MLALPHIVTKAQVGLGNADNTSDVLKPISTAQAAVNSAKADLINGFVSNAQLPAYVDDVLEFASLAAFPVVGETGKIYIDLATNITYRWSGSIYAEISASLALGETLATAYRGDSGKIAYDHSQVAHEPVGAASSGDSAHLLNFAHGDIAHTNRAALDLVSGTNTGDQTALQVANTPAGNIVATNVQAALNELDVEKVSIAGTETITGAKTFTAATTMATVTASGLVSNAAGADIASATTVNLTTATGNTVIITGTTPTTALTMNTGQQMILLPSGAWPLTYHGTTMNINGGVDYTCKAGDRLYCVKDLAGVIHVSVIQKDAFTATGGTITTSGAYTIHTFTTSGTFTPNKSGSVDYLVVAGGAGGAPLRTGGGGGAGGYRCSVAGETSGGGAAAEEELLVLAQHYTVTIGGGGAANTQGSNSVFFVTSLGGGRGGDQTNNAGAGGSGFSGGSGGGSRSNTPGALGGDGTSGQGYRGGNNAAGTLRGTGGGGAAATGNDVSVSDSGIGGVGRASSINGTSTTRAGGGGGGSSLAENPIGGSGGGGSGANSSNVGATAGTANTGGGGGGGGGSAGATGGGSGIVIIRYLT